MAADVKVLASGEGHTLSARGSTLVFKAVGADTGGRFSFMERTLPPGGRPPPAHRHTDIDEAFYVLEGTFTFRLGDRIETVEAGGFVLVPRGAPHTFANESDAPARILIVHAPALDPYFEALSALHAAGSPTPDDERALQARHGMEPA